MTTNPLLPRLHRSLATPARRIVDACCRQAVAQDARLYVVGGALRDLLSRRAGRLPRHLDLDLALDGDARALVDAVVTKTGASVVSHHRFGAARLRLDGVRVDLVRTRRERYPRPGALPVVRPGPIADDLARRDFSVNAMALALTGPQAGTLLDPFHGHADLRAGRIRILHDASFRDDPTRLLRFCRYAARLHARPDRTTAHAIHQALQHDHGALRTLSAPRFGTAWRLLLTDPAASDALEQARRLHLTNAWLPGWRLQPRAVRAFAALRAPTASATNADASAAFWALMGLTLADEAVLDAMPARCALLRAEAEALAAGRILRAAQPALGRRDASASTLAGILRPLPDVAIMAGAKLWRGRAAARLVRYERTRRHVQSPLDAAALRALGVKDGPQLGAWLAALRDAALDGRLPRGRRAAAAATRWVQWSDGGPPRTRHQDRRASAQRRPARRQRDSR